MRKKLVAGNWKMNMSLADAEAFIKQVVPSLESEAMIFAPFTLLPSLVELSKNSKLSIGAQNMYFEEKGAYTGEISPEMLLDIGVKHVVLGHSERRTIFGETDQMINQKLHAALKHGIKPILCVGESLETRERGDAENYVKHQLEEDLNGFDKVAAESIIIAYEPIWAIGTGKTASSSDASGMATFIRGVLKEMYGDVSEKIRILYGGSVKPANIAELLSSDQVDGALVGGASLNPDFFTSMVYQAEGL